MAFVRDNPQLLYTIFLMVAVPVAFFVSGYQFLRSSQNIQTKVEQTYVASVHDALVDTVREKFNDPSAVQDLINQVSKRNEDIIRMVVLTNEGDRAHIIASSRTSEQGAYVPIGTTDDPTKPGYELAVTVSRGSGTYAFEMADANGRFWRSVQAVRDGNDAVIGFLLTDISMKQLDAISQRNIYTADLWALFLVLAIMILLLRHARIVDYTVLYRKLAEVDKLKDDFISMAAHELRTPLSIIRGYASMLVESKSLAEGDHHQAELIDRSAVQLNALVEDLLNVMRIEQGRMDFTFVSLDLASAAQEVADMFSISAREKGLALTYEKNGAVMAVLDADRIRQVLINIVGNAVKYTPAGAVTIKVFSDDTKKRAVVRVSDTGIGISAEEQKNLFGKFYRVKSDETKQIRGTGLGLWITKQLVLNMKGTISVESIKGKGTDIEVSFPLVG